MVPSAIGTSYFLPVRLSVIERVLLPIRPASLSNVAISGGDDCHRHKCGRFGAQTAAAEALEESAVFLRQLDFALAEAAFRADENGCRLSVVGCLRLRVCVEHGFVTLTRDRLLEFERRLD